MASSAPSEDRVRLARLVANARWISIVFGLVEAVIGTPAPISRPAMVVGLLVSAAYNVVAMRPGRFSAPGLERLLAILVIADFVVISNSVAMNANSPIDDGYLLYVLVALEAAILFGVRGSVGFLAGFVLAFVLWATYRHSVFHFSEPVGSYVFGIATMTIIALFAGGMTRISNAATHRERLHADEADDARRTLSGFVNILVHELRAPLTVIAGYSEILTESEHDPEQVQSALRAINAKADEMSATVEELLLVSRLEASKEKLDVVAVDARELVARAVERAKPRAQLMHAEIVSNGEPVGTVMADKHAVDRILDNLINNALNYGGSTPLVDVHVEINGTHARICVSDHGEGIAEEMQERVFERFVRGNPETSRPGSGLGLWVARELARQQGGDLVLERSAPGQGSSFVVRLQLAG